MKRTLIDCAMLGLLGLALPCSAVSANGSPNIVFILTDDQGWADLNTPMDPSAPQGACAYFHTPNMDRLAREGMRFASGYASAPFCTPTRRSIQFGMTPARQRGTEFVSDSFTPTGHLSIPQALKRANPSYRCAHFGKWGEVMSGTWRKNPELAGYDESEPESEANPQNMGYDQSDGLTGNGTGTFYHPTYRCSTSLRTSANSRIWPRPCPGRPTRCPPP